MEEALKGFRESFHAVLVSASGEVRRCLKMMKAARLYKGMAQDSQMWTRILDSGFRFGGMCRRRSAPRIGEQDHAILAWGMQQVFGCCCCYCCYNSSRSTCLCTYKYVDASTIPVYIYIQMYVCVCISTYIYIYIICIVKSGHGKCCRRCLHSIRLSLTCHRASEMMQSDAHNLTEDASKISTNNHRVLRRAFRHQRAALDCQEFRFSF